MPFISDITHLQNRALLFIDGLYTLNRYLHSLMKLLLTLMMMMMMMTMINAIDAIDDSKYIVDNDV